MLLSQTFSLDMLFPTACWSFCCYCFRCQLLLLAPGRTPQWNNHSDEQLRRAQNSGHQSCSAPLAKSVRGLPQNCKTELHLTGQKYLGPILQRSWIGKIIHWKHGEGFPKTNSSEHFHLQFEWQWEFIRFLASHIWSAKVYQFIPLKILNYMDGI